MLYVFVGDCFVDRKGNVMKFLLKVLLVVFILVFVVYLYVVDKKFVVVIDMVFVLFEFKQGDKYVGFDVDLWDVIVKELKLDYILKLMDFSGIILVL